MSVQHWGIVIVVVALLLVLWMLLRRMARLNNTRETLSGRRGAQLPLATEPSARVKELSATPGTGVEAIRALRAQTRLGVRAAVQIVDALCGRRRAKAVRDRSVRRMCRAPGAGSGAVLVCLGLLMSQGAAALASPTSAYRCAQFVRTTTAVKAALVRVNRHIDDMGDALNDAPGTPALLDGLWSAVRHWAAVRLDAGQSVRSIVAEARGVFGDHSPPGWQTLSALRLDSDSIAFGVNMSPLGTVFILRRRGPDTFTTAMDIGNPHTWGGAKAGDFAAWQSRNATERAQAGDHRGDVRPLRPVKLVRLPNESDGAERFAVVGNRAQIAGGLLRFQVSIWRWRRVLATPLLTVNLSQTIELPVIAHVGRARLVLQEKGHFSQFYTCAECAGRQLALTVDLPARGARLGAVRSLTPQLDLADTFFRSRRGRGSA